MLFKFYVLRWLLPIVELQSSINREGKGRRGCYHLPCCFIASNASSWKGGSSPVSFVFLQKGILIKQHQSFLFLKHFKLCAVLMRGAAGKGRILILLSLNRLRAPQCQKHARVGDRGLNTEVTVSRQHVRGAAEMP